MFENGLRYYFPSGAIFCPSWFLSHIRHNKEPTLSRNDSPLGCLHLALSYIYLFMFPCTGSRVITSYERTASCARTRCRSRVPPAIMPSILIAKPRPVCQKRTTCHIVSYTWHNNEPTMGRNDSTLGCLHVALVYRLVFLCGGNMITCFRVLAAG